MSDKSETPKTNISRKIKQHTEQATPPTDTDDTAHDPAPTKHTTEAPSADTTTDSDTADDEGNTGDADARTDAQPPDAQIRFIFRARTLFRNDVSINEECRYIDTIETDSGVTRIQFTDDVGTVSLGTGSTLRTGYTLTMPLSLDAISPDLLADKFETAVAYLDAAIDDRSRRLSPTFSIICDDPRAVADDYDDTFTTFGEQRFNATHEREFIGTDKGVKYIFRNGDAVEL